MAFSYQDIAEQSPTFVGEDSFVVPTTNNHHDIDTQIATDIKREIDTNSTKAVERGPWTLPLDWVNTTADINFEFPASADYTHRRSISEPPPPVWFNTEPSFDMPFNAACHNISTPLHRDDWWDGNGLMPPPSTKRSTEDDHSSTMRKRCKIDQQSFSRTEAVPGFNGWTLPRSGQQRTRPTMASARVGMRSDKRILPTQSSEEFSGRSNQHGRSNQARRLHTTKVDNATLPNQSMGISSSDLMVLIRQAVRDALVDVGVVSA